MRFIRLLAVAVTIVVMIVLWLPGDVLESVARWARDWLPWQPTPSSDALGHTDKVVHFLLFAISGGLLALAWRQVPGGPLWGLMIALALVTEAGQIFIPGRGWDWWDVAADMVGAGVAIIIVRAVRPALKS